MVGKPGGTAARRTVGEEDAPHRQRIVLEGPVLWAAIALVLLVAVSPWVYLSWRSREAGEGAAAAPVRGAPVTEDEPWGRLEAFDIVIAAPLEFVHSVEDLELSLDWRLRDTSREQFAEMLAHLALDEPVREQLLSLARVDAGQDLVITPTEELIWQLKPEARATLYHALALDKANQVQTQAFRFAGSLEDWFAGSGVSGETLKLLEKLAYRYNESTFLADLHVLLPKLSKQEQVRVLKAASGQRTYSLRLRVMADDNIAALTDYWGRGRRSKDVRPLLESLARIPGGGTIDVAHLLPGFARTRLYTYPTPTDGSESLQQNAEWTAFNFFASLPEDRLADREQAAAELKANYHPIYHNPALGDLVVFSDDADPMFHVAVYVADDFVFTKNGTPFYLPWMYVRVDQIKDFYARPLPVKVSYYRHKSL